MTAVLSGAVLVELDGRVMSLFGPGATAVPNGLRVAGDLPALPVGGPATSGNGQLRLPGVDIVVTRIWPTRVPRTDVDPGRLELLTELIEGTDAGLAVPTTAATTADELANRLVGFGPGLTPAGDDLLCGVLVGRRAAGNDAGAAELGAAVRRALSDPRRTTAFSAQLLRLAAAGHACLEVLAVLTALRRGAARPAPAGAAGDPRLPQATQATMTTATRRLCRIGHTSGPALAAGLLAGLRSGIGAERAAA